MQNRHQSPTDEESLEGQARRIVRSIPIQPIMYDGTYEEFSIGSQESAVSELSFSSDSSVSDFTVVGEPIVELPSTPPKEAVEVRTRFRSLDQTLTPGTIGEALEKSGTVLMQRSRENRLAKQLVEMQTLIGADDELVVLKQPSTVRRMHSQPAFTPEVMRGFLEHSETMFHLVHETQTESNMNEERTDPSEVVKTEAREVVEGDGEGEFVGCFSKNDDLVMYKRTVKGARADAGERRESLDTLIAQHAQCLVEADNVTQPKVQIYQSNDENVLALLTFSEQSAAVLKTPSSTVDGVNSYEDLNRVLLQTYRQLLTRPDEMISMQTHRPAGASGSPQASPHIHKPRSDLLSSRSDGSTSFGLTNASRSGVCLEGSSKNWNKYPNARKAIEIVTNLRLMLEEFILRKIPATASVVKFLARLLTDVMHCSPVEVGEQFQQLSLIEKIKQVIDELLMPHELEDPLQMVNQAKLTMKQILDYRVQVHTIGDFAKACERISGTAERLVCELDHDIEDTDAFIEALQYGLKSLLGAEDPREVLEQTPGTSSSAKEESHSPHHATIGEESTRDIPLLPTTLCHCFTSSFWLFLGSSAVWLKEFFINFWHFLTTTPPILLGPSVSFRETVLDDNSIVQELHVQRHHLNQTMNVLQLVLEKSPSEVKSTGQQDGNLPTTSVNVRSLKLFAQLLQQAGSIELSHSDSHHHLHLQLRESISGNLEKRQTDGICMLAGDIRDHEESVAVCFDARMYDLDTLSENESAIECITRVERLSCDKDEEREEVEGQESVVNSIVEEIISTDHFGSVKGSNTQSVEALQEESMRKTMQELLEPVIATLRNVQERMEDIGGDRCSQPRVSSPGTIAFGLVERLHDSPPKSIKKEERYMNMDVPLTESLQELISMFHDANERLAIIDCDVTAIRNQVQHLVSEQLRQLESLQHQPRQAKGGKPIQGDGHRTKRRRSSQKQANRQRKSRSSEGDKKELTAPIPCCPIKQTFPLPPSKNNCPAEIYSCHGVAPDVLVIHWNVDKDVIQHIAGYEIYVDGVLRSVCFSNKRRTALIANINLRQQHLLMLHANPVSRCKNLAKWEPAIFLYHL
ncbi:uncharacterized protein LOC131284798 [Anopheles ziemanni]|uniref:uncharacterized protein LOC131261602 n=1 Tax=Anopheles coustani TaxID=139045 RepID=UPI00265B2478|nr:uncharacterized protein LOC131261602 [Anopheles coustani]XP_058169640.1 uncharacterized protein LOC131284798 [Anopheles ziemanni]